MFLRLGFTSVEIDMWNPLHAVVPFVLLVLSIPLATLAIITTSIGVTLLSLRAFVAYLQLATAVIAAWLSPPSTKSPNIKLQYPARFFSGQISPLQQHDRRCIDSTDASQDTSTPTIRARPVAKKSDSLTALVGTGDMTQDFEGVGGWRVAADDEEEALWMGIAPRQTTPVEGTTRRHQRSLTGGASPSQRWSFSPEAFRMSPVQSRARTPLRFAAESENSYFPPHPINHIRHHVRTTSGSGSGSSGSMSSTFTVSGTTMAGKQAAA